MKTGVAIIVAGTAVAVFLSVFFIAGKYHSPLLSDTRNLKEVGWDFVGFGWHYSRYFWRGNARDWPNANRQRLLAFWHRPDWSGFNDLREKSLFELGCWYERFSLPEHASLLFLEAVRREPENRWLLRQSAARMQKMKQWEPLEELRSLILDGNSEDREIRTWLEQNCPAPAGG